MAQIIPSTPLSSLPSEILKVYRFLKSLPEGYVVWHHLTPWEKEAPDFMILNKNNQVILVKVSMVAKSTHSSAQMLLLGEAKPLGEEENLVLELFKNKFPVLIKDRIVTVVLFPNINSNKLETDYRNENTGQHHWIGQEMIQTNAIEHWEELFSGEKLTATMLEQLRYVFTPEIVIPKELTVRPTDTERHAAGLEGYLLDTLQEAAVKNDLEIPSDREITAKDFHIGIINGVAGSGKTLILLYRLRLLHSNFPNHRFLILTHNRPLIRDIRSKYKLLTGDMPKNITWKTFNGFCRQYWPEKENSWTNPIRQSEREHVARTIWEKKLTKTSIQIDNLLSEIDWFKDQIPMDKSKYLQTERKGRRFRLNQDQRLAMWDAMSDYQNQLIEQNKMDWGDVPRRMWNFLRENKVQLPKYDFVMIDEAQFFAPIWFDIIRQIAKPKISHLFIVADPTQGFLGRGTSWKSLGIDARGKTQNMRRSYRSTHEILNFATLLYRRRIKNNDADEDIIEPDLMNMPHGALPIVISLRSAQDEIGRITAEIEALNKHGVPLRNILILHSEWEGVKALIMSLNNRLGEGTAIDPKETTSGDCIRVTTLNAGTGLESPVVFLVGLNRILEMEQSLRLSDDEIEKLVLENTRKIYMAATRAGQRLIITYVGEIPNELKDIIQIPAR
ncbi:MAG: DEAD/DEAH box helicase [Anaerolineales bacterium]|nr:DEAD/DEAH box helicase [Anaerolineales bacterium]MBX3037007.1 DEAD/DEAH box helicase [Anaerolineales bacterium]